MGAEKKIEAGSYWSCSYIESGLTLQNAGLMFCCERNNPEILEPKKSAKETVDAFLQMRQRVIEVNQTDAAPCKGCPLFQKREWSKEKEGYRIDFLNFGVQSHCQFSCIYCSLQRDEQLREQKNKPEPFDSLNIANEFKRRNMLAEHLRVDYASGEIAIHPQKTEYLDFIEKNAFIAAFSSNAGKYDEEIANILGNNTRNNITVSMDAGTRETFALVHGINRFDAVIANLEKYKQKGAQIYLKYILLKENCDKNNIDSFIDICSRIGVVELVISGDCIRTRDFTSKAVTEPEIVQGAVWLVEGAIKHNIPFRMNGYLGIGNLNQIYAELAQNEEIKACEKRMDMLLKKENLILYGAGKNCELLLDTWSSLRMKRPNVLWDISASRKKGEEAGEKRWGFSLFPPEFETLDSTRDAVLITVTNGETNAALQCTMQNLGFCNVMTWYDLQMALIAKMALINKKP